jgi:hypothetical protein
MTFQVDAQTTLLIDPVTFKRFLRKGTLEQKKAVRAQLAQLIWRREQALIHPPAPIAAV